MDILNRLAKSKFRSRFKLRAKELEYIKDKGLYPLQLVLKQILIEADEAATGGSDVTVMSETVQYAVMVVATIPILLVYPFLQKYFVKGMTVGAVKG